MSRQLYSVLRWLHVYVSMLSFLTILFFAITGITLNHPEWTLGLTQTTEDFSGELPVSWRTGDVVAVLGVSEHLRAEHGVQGSLADYRLDEFEGSIAFRAPGYFADAFIDPDTGGYDLTVVQMGVVGVLNELHRGTDAGERWVWIIDIAGGLLALLAVTGLGLLLYLKKFRPSGLFAMAAGSAAVVMLILRFLV